MGSKKIARDIVPGDLFSFSAAVKNKFL